MLHTKKIISIFVHQKFFIFNFYIAHWQHDALRDGPRNKETFNQSVTHFLDIRK